MYLKYGNMCSHTNRKKYRYYIVFHSTEHFFVIKCMHFFHMDIFGGEMLLQFALIKL